MKVISGVYWDKGKRDANQDSLILEQVLTKKGRVVLAAVCDGIGGLKEGEVASGFIAERLREVFYDELIGLVVKGKSRKKIEKCFLRCCFEINDALQCYGEGKRVLLGATMSVLLLWKGHYMTVHLGDSRIFCLAGKKSVRQITKDHRRSNNTLTKCMGSFAYQKPDVVCKRRRGKKAFLLCSDGFYRCISDKMFADSLMPGQVKEERQIAKRLKELAAYSLKKGERDNMSAVYLLCR